MAEQSDGGTAVPESDRPTLASTSSVSRQDGDGRHSTHMGEWSRRRGLYRIHKTILPHPLGKMSAKRLPTCGRYLPTFCQVLSGLSGEAPQSQGPLELLFHPGQQPHRGGGPDTDRGQAVMPGPRSRRRRGRVLILQAGQGFGQAVAVGGDVVQLDVFVAADHLGEFGQFDDGIQVVGTEGG